MYSRYTPNADGGFDRRQFPDAADLRTAQGRSPPSEPEEPREREVRGESASASPEQPSEASRYQSPVPGWRSPPQPNPRNSRPMRFRPGPGRRAPGGGPDAGVPGRPPGTGIPSVSSPNPSLPPLFGGLMGPGGLLAQLLPHGLDSEDLLILAILLLSMKQDGASPTELLIAAGLYFWL